MAMTAVEESGLGTHFRQSEVPRGSLRPRELSLVELELISGGDINWGAVYQGATAGLVGGAIGGAIVGGVGGSFAGGIGAGPGALAGGLGGAVGGAVTGGLGKLFEEMAK